MGYVFEQTSYRALSACIAVQRQIGPKCMEVDYQRALEIALPGQCLSFLREAEIPIYFDGQLITRRRVDFVIWDDHNTILLEIKAAREIHSEDVEQCLLYLHNGNFRICLLANFGQVPLGKRRFVHSPTGPAIYGPHP